MRLSHMKTPLPKFHNVGNLWHHSRWSEHNPPSDPTRLRHARSPPPRLSHTKLQPQRGSLHAVLRRHHPQPWFSMVFLFFSFFFCRKDTFAPRTDRSSLSPGNSTPTRVPTFGTRSGGYEGPPRTRVIQLTNRPRDRPRMTAAIVPSIRSKKVSSVVISVPGGDFAI